MVLCFVALAVFAVLSIFSAKYRPLFKRSLQCVFLKATLRPCDTGLDEEIKAQSIAGLMKLSPKAANALNRHFQAFSFIFTILFFASLFFAAQGIYNFMIYGNCNGLEGGFCIYSGIAGNNPSLLKPPTDLKGITYGNESANITVVEFGCYVCPYTRSAENDVRGLLSKYGDRIYFVFKPFPLPNHPYSKEAAIAAECANEEGKYWEYRALLFDNQKDVEANGTAALSDVAGRLNLSGFESCMASGRYDPMINVSVSEGDACGIYGTPTIFVNGQAFVGESAAKQAETRIQQLLAQ
ncbi:MAG: thioredoxin domain-containing protein [Candidatus Micrarchaeia archaeon]